MYERFRSEFLTAANDAGIRAGDLVKALQVMDQVATKYDFAQKELSLAVYNQELPDAAKAYLICKKIAGLSDRTLETYKRTLEIFFRHFHKPLEMITANDIRVFLFQYQQERKCSNRSLDKYRGYLSSFFAWAATEDYIRRDPMRSIQPIKYERKQRQNLSQLELEYLRKACQTPRERAIVEFLFSTGCRVSELSGVKKSDVDWNDRSVHLFGKGKKHRDSYINAKAEVALKAYLETRSDDCQYLFVSERKPYRQIQPAAIEKVVRIIASRSAEKINKNITPHVLRHTTATLALEKGMPIEEISKLLGHEQINTTMIYAQTSQASVQAGHRRYVI